MRPISEKTFLFSLFLLAVTSCDKFSSESNYSYSVDFPEAPIEIMSSSECNSIYDSKGLNYFNIIQINESLYYMYYSSFGEDSDGSDISQKMLFAFSNDLFHWEKKIPERSHNLILENIADASVSYNPFEEYPFRCVCRKIMNGESFLAMYKSKNGYDFTFCKNLLEGKFDTQSACVENLNGGGYLLFTRMWNEEHSDRWIGVANIDKNDQIIDSLHNIGLHYVYNPAPSKIDNRFIILFPSYMNNLDGSTDDTMAIKSYLFSDKGIVNEIDNCMLKWELSPQVYVCPGIIEQNGDKYISYQVKNISHDVSGLSETKYKLMKISINKVFQISE